MISKKVFSLIYLTIVISILFTACVKDVKVSDGGDFSNPENPDPIDQANFVVEKYEPTNVDIPYNPVSIIAKVDPYKVKEDLSNIANLESLGGFSKEQIELIVRNNFVVNPTNEQQLFYIYEENEYLAVPSFITTDSVLHTYHIFYDYYLRTLENEKLLPLVEDITDKMLLDSILIYNSIKNEEVKAAQLKNIAFFATAQLCLEKQLPSDIPNEAKDMANRELELIEDHTGFQASEIFPYELDYSQYVPRGHYTRSEDFKRYFKAMMYYGQAPFSLYIEKNGVIERNIEQTLQALLISHSIYSDKETYDNWENIYEPTNFFVGSSDDLGIYDYSDLLFKVYGNEPDLEQLNDKDKLDKLYKEADKLPEPKIQAKYTSVGTPTGKQFRFMGQRYILDSDIIQELVEPILRPVPSGLDVMAVLGSMRSEEIQIEKEENKYWDKYIETLHSIRDRTSKRKENEWMSNIYNGWLWTLKGLLKPFGDGYPSFMTNQAWVDKDLNTALGSWSELKHDTILYGKQSGAEKGGYDMPVVGYVEPNIEVYEKLLWLTTFSRENLNQRDLGIEAIDEKMIKFEELLQFLIDCSVKELNNEELTRDEYNRIGYYGAVLEDLMNSFVDGDGGWFEISSDTDKNMAVIADFHTIAPNQYSDAGYLETGVGTAHEIYVVVPIGGELYLSRGAVFSYYEFIADERLTDETWQEMLNTDTNPPAPEWTKSFIKEGKGEIPYPDYD